MRKGWIAENNGETINFLSGWISKLIVIMHRVARVSRDWPRRDLIGLGGSRYESYSIDQHDRVIDISTHLWFDEPPIV